MTLGNEPRMSLQWIKRAIERANVEREGKRDGEGLMSSSIKVSGMEVWQSLLECPSRNEPAGEGRASLRKHRNDMEGFMPPFGDGSPGWEASLLGELVPLPGIK